MARFFCWGLILVLASASFLGCVVSYERPPAGKNIFVPHDLDSTSSPQQVHISMVGNDKMRITWITEDPTPATVDYGAKDGVYDSVATGTTMSYKYTAAYKSGQIHEVLIGPLKPNTVYYYRCGGSDARKFSFKTPPVELPLKFAVVGDLGQTEWTKSTLQHIAESDYDVLILPGDLAYADLYQPLWDSFGRLVEPLASQRPWMVTQGNHEVETIPLVHSTPFTAYTSRWHMPYEESGSNSNLYYSFEVVGVHVIMLGSYTDFDADSAQYKWLQSDLVKIDRKKTPWVIVLVHAPWYNSNKAHQGEKESVGMKTAMEGLLYQARVDLVFAGHVHAYERFNHVYSGQNDKCGPMYINIGDGGNREGLAREYDDPQPIISLFREASFGHGQLEVVNATQALWQWHRNDDNESVVGDEVWLTNLASIPDCKA